jgi:signal transduction histidine kinase
MSGSSSLAAGLVTAISGSLVLAGWALGYTGAASLVSGWRVMVPSTAFSFTCVGLGLVAAATSSFERPIATLAVRALAAVVLVLPVCTLLEYVFGVRWGVESWLGFSFAADPVDPFAGRMSPVTSACFVLLGTALGALTWPSSWGPRLVRLAGGAALTISWLAVLAVSFDTSRLEDTPRFPGMAVATIILLAVASAGVLASSTQVVTRLRDADADVAIPPWLLAIAFVVPLLLGRLQRALDARIDPGLSAMIVTVISALGVTVVVWRGAARMQGLQRQRRAVLAELEARVADRTQALADANEQLRQNEERLREADRRKDEFLATLAHELRNPLAPIRTGFELLRSSTAPAAVKTQANEVIDRQMEHMVRLIDDLLDVSRIAADKLKLRHDLVDLNQIVRQAVETSRPAIEAERQQLELHLPLEPAIVVGDATRLTQVVVNLVQNACKYTQPGGHIMVAAALSEGRVEVRVRDNGIGIPPPFLPTLFEPFSQVAPAMERSQGGLGLGLALVRGIVTLHGGSVEARSEGSGHGSEFLVLLPLAADDDVKMLPPTVGTISGADRVAPLRVLVVDDNDDNTDVLAMLLRERGHVVATAGDGEAAYQTAEMFRPEVVLLDIGMPKLNGYDVCRKIRQTTWGRDMRIIAQTGWGQTQDRKRSEEAGFDGHLVKPIDPSMLDALLRQ